MASAYSPWWKRRILYLIPFLYKLCPGFNYHPAWHKKCECSYPEVYYFRNNCYVFGRKVRKEKLIIPNHLQLWWKIKYGWWAKYGHWNQVSFWVAMDHLIRGGRIKLGRL